MMGDEPEIEIVETGEEVGEEYLRREYPWTYENTPEDDAAELRLRSAMLWLRDADHPEFADVAQTRDGVAAHTGQAAAEAFQDVAGLIGEGPGRSALTTQAHAYLWELIDNGGRSDPPKITRAERYRRTLAEADQGHLEQGRFVQLWEKLKENAR